MDLFEEKVTENVVYNGNFLTVYKDSVKLPNEKIANRELVQHPGAACVLVLDGNDNILMVKQYRYPVKKLMYELPAGKLDCGEDPIDCAYRELEEETGYKANKLDLIGIVYPTPAYSTEIIYIYLASDLKQSKINLDEDEFLICEKINLNKVVNMIVNNEITDAKTQIAILKYLIMRSN